MMNTTPKGASRLGLALLAGATLSCSSLIAQTPVTLVYDSFDSSSAGSLNGRVPDQTVNGAAWVAGAKFTLPGNNAASATISSPSETASIDLGSSAFFNTPGVYTLSVDIDFPTGSTAGGWIALAFMSDLAALTGSNQTILLRDLAASNQSASACTNYHDGNVAPVSLTGTAIGGTDSPFTLNVYLVVTNTGFWQMNSSITNRDTGITYYPRGTSNPRKITLSPSPIRYVGLHLGGGNANSPVIDNFKLTRTDNVAPAFFHLSADQASGQDWRTLTHWNTKENGSGTAALAIANFHDYFTNNRILRSPAVSDPMTFPGGSLTINGGGLELRQTSASADVTIERLVSRGGFINNSAGAWVTKLNAANFSVSKTGMDTVISANGSGRTLQLAVGRLAGAGTLDIHGGGTVQITAGDATKFTGRISKASGTSLQLIGPINSKATMVISNAAEVNVTGTVTVGALTVAGSVKNPRSYTAAELGFLGSGSVVVETPRPEAEVLFGVNLAGAEGGSVIPGTKDTDYKYPTEEELDYYKARGFKLIRLPFRWERIQRQFPNGPLDPNELGAMDAVMDKANDRGMKVILDMHNYSKRRINGVWYEIGSTTVPITAYADAWNKIAAEYKSHPALYGYDVMNEPIGSYWVAATEAAVAAIRDEDTTHFIIVENDSHAGAQYWDVDSTLDSINDGAADRMIYSAHSYWDIDLSNSTYNGIYEYKYDQQAAYPDLGMELAKKYVDWCNARDVRGFVGEYGIPNNPQGANADIRWNNVLFRFLQCMEFNGISGTYWAGGPFWLPNHGSSCEPKTLTDPDRPVMPVLRAFTNPMVYEMESIATVSATPNSVSTLNEPQMNAGVGEALLATAVGNSISYTLPNVPKGRYQIFARVKKHSARGKYELFIDGSSTRQGLEQDQYAAGTVYAEQDLGAVTFSATGNKVFTFRVSGKGGTATNYFLAFDSIRLQPLGIE